MKALGGAMFYLAGERFSLDAQSGNVAILTLRNDADWRSQPVRKLGTDYDTVVLPWRREHDDVGLCIFVSHYNSRTYEYANGLIRAGEYRRGRLILEALIELDTCGSVVSMNAKNSLRLLGDVEVDEKLSGEVLEQFSDRLAPAWKTWGTGVGARDGEGIEKKKGSPLSGIE